MKRKFRCKTLPMLIAAMTVTDYFESEKEAFVEEMPGWSDPFIANFRADIQQILDEYFGISSKGDLEDQTRMVNELTKNAKDDLDMVKTQIERGFRANPETRKKILAQLGFKEYWSKASHRNQSMMIGLLLTFRNNLNEELRAELETNLVNSNRLTQILSYADELNQANMTQESLKGSTKLDTEEAILVLNTVYEQAIDICAIGKQLFRREPLRKELFVFSKLVKKQQNTNAQGSTNDETPVDDPVAQPQ